MRQSHPCSLAGLIADTQFEKLQRKSAQLIQLNEQLQLLLKKHAIKHCRVANFRNGILILEIGSAAWLNRFHYLRPHILSELRQAYPALASLEITINPRLMQQVEVQAPSSPTVQAKPRRLSPQAAQHLTELAQDAPAGLKEKLEKLAALVEKNAHD